MLKGFVLLGCFLVAGVAWGEEISVEGVRPVRVDTYRGVERIFRRFEGFAAQDRAGLSLRITGVLEPGDRPVQEAMPYLAEATGVVPIFGPVGDEMRLPEDAGLWERDPPVFARLGRGQRVGLGFRIVVSGFTGAQFTNGQARGWLRQLDGCIEDEAGAVVAFLLPDTHKLIVMVAAGASFEVREGAASRVLVRNGGAVPYRFVFRPQDFGRDAVFVSDRALGEVFMEIPFSVRGEWKRGVERGKYQAGR